MVPMMGQISRGTGHNCPSSLPMLAAAFCLEDTSDLSVYETNMNLLYDTFKELGFTVPRPGGTFYIMPKALEEDAVAFCKKALKYDLVFVPGDGFKAPGFFRVAYCVDTEKVERSLAAIRRFVLWRQNIRTGKNTEGIAVTAGLNRGRHMKRLDRP